jgi:hypothetical protein
VICHARRYAKQCIVHRTKVIDYVLAAEQRKGRIVTLGDALTELLTDISEAARTIDTILLRELLRRHKPFQLFCPVEDDVNLLSRRQ